MNSQTTGQVAEELGTTERRVQTLIRDGKMPRPPKVRGKCAWERRHKDKLREVLARNP